MKHELRHIALLLFTCLMGFDVCGAYCENGLKDAQKALYREEPDRAIALANTILGQNDEKLHLPCIAQAHFVLGRAHLQKKQLAVALNYFLQTLQEMEKAGMIDALTEVYFQIGKLYVEWEIYDKAIESLAKTQEMSAFDQDSPIKLETLSLLAGSFEKINDYQQSIAHYKQLLGYCIEQKDNKAQLKMLKAISDLYLKNQQPEKALEIQKEILEINQEQDNLSGVATAHNNMGYLDRQINDPENSLSHFLKAHDFFIEKNALTLEEKDRLSVITENIGFLYLFSGQGEEALASFKEALSIKEPLGDSLSIAETLTNISSTHLLLKEYLPAREYAKAALNLSQSDKGLAVRTEAYKNLSELYETLKQHRKALVNYKFYSASKEALLASQSAAQSEISERQVEIEKKEKELRILIANREINDLQYKQLSLENERKLQELKILKQENELRESAFDQQRLQKERALQDLLLAKQKFSTENKDREIESLQKDKQIQELALKEQRLREAEKQKEMEVLERERELQTLKLKEEADTRKWLTGISLLTFLFLILVAFAYVQQKNSKQKLAKQKEEITLTAERLQTANQNVSNQKEKIEQQKNQLVQTFDLLSRKNRDLTASISYAQSIQQAILPKPSEFDQLFADHFIIYLPRDIVSGDFYWLFQSGLNSAQTSLAKHTYLAVADCTGHGVPGAFMSLIGTALLNRIVIEMQIDEPQEILTLLSAELAKELNQSGKVTDDGMEISLCKIEPLPKEKFKLSFAGAKHGLSIFTKEDKTVSLIKGANKGIGGFYNQKKLHFHQIEHTLNKGDRLYLFTDGFKDQCNPQREKLGLNQLENFIEGHQHFSLKEQRKSFEQLLIKHQQSADQRDDITLVAVEV